MLVEITNPNSGGDTKGCFVRFSWGKTFEELFLANQPWTPGRRRSRLNDWISSKRNVSIYGKKESLFTKEPTRTGIQ